MKIQLLNCFNKQQKENFTVEITNKVLLEQPEFEPYITLIKLDLNKVDWESRKSQISLENIYYVNDREIVTLIKNFYTKH